MKGKTTATGLTLNDWSQLAELAQTLQDESESAAEETDTEIEQTGKQATKSTRKHESAPDAAGISAEEMQRRYEVLLEETPALLEQDVEVALGEAVESAGCVTQPFEIGLGRVLAIKGKIKFCGTSGSHWTLLAKSSFYALGHRLWTETDKITPQHLGKCHSLNFTAAKASFCYGITGARLCFYVKGKFCYWKFGWHCKSFHKTLHCFR